MLNKVILKGNIGRTPKIEFTQDGREIAIFSLATRISWKDTTGEWQQHTDWHRITVFREPTVKWLKDALKQGDTVYVEGRLTYHQWTDKYSQPRITPTIIVSRQDGKVEYLRSRKPEVGTEIQTSDEQNNHPQMDDPQGSDFEEEHSAENSQLFEASPTNQNLQDSGVLQVREQKLHLSSKTGLQERAAENTKENLRTPTRVSGE